MSSAFYANLSQTALDTHQKTEYHQRNTRKIEGNLHQILFDCAVSGQITELVIRYGTYYDRLLWAMTLAAAADESDEDFDHGEQLIEWGKTDTENLRKTLQRFPEKVEKWMKKAGIRIPA